MIGRTSLPLYGKILGWLALNAVLLLAAFAAALWFGFGIRPDMMLRADATGQVGSVGRLLVSELRRSPRYEWDEIVARYDDAYQVRFILLGPRGEQQAGTVSVLPPAIMARVRTERGERDDRRPPGLREDERRGDPPKPPRGGVTSIDGFYWSVQRLPSGGRPGDGPPPPVWLVVRSDSLSAGGLFLNMRPWLTGVGVAALFSVLWWLPFVRGITGAISAMEAATVRVAGGGFDLTGRVADRRGRFGRALRRQDELGGLARAIAEMARRLEGFVTGQRRFLGDIAHELCAPIARGQVAVEILAQRVAGSERERVEDVREEVEEMSKLVNELLSFSKAAIGAGGARFESVSVAEAVREAAEREASGADVRVEVAGDLCAEADAALMQRAVGNLIRNAVRYAGEAGPVAVMAGAEGGWVKVTVEDCGPGVPQEAVRRLFDPFYRVDESRDRETGGVGLGLAIVKSAVEACGGTVRCCNREPRGFAVEMRFRLSQEKPEKPSIP